MDEQIAASSFQPEAYFIRHTRKLGIEDSFLERLADENRIFIHFPHGEAGPSSADLASIDPNDHERRGRKALTKLRTLATTGGLVCAEYWHKPAQALIGFVRARSDVELIHGRWGNRYEGCCGRTAIVKSLQLEKTRWLSSSEYLPLAAGRPRQGTIGRWRKAAHRIHNLVHRLAPLVDLPSLGPDHQEVLCAEALRVPEIAARFGLVPIQHLIFPIGRTRKDIDIDGIDANGDRVLIQVTYHTLEAAAGKLGTLRSYAAPATNLILVCRTATTTTVDGVKILPLESIFSAFSTQPSGAAWLKATSP